jgi:4'-phosphopantetheinyl transferase
VDLWLRPVGPLAGSEPAGDRLLAPEEQERAARFLSDEARALFVLGRSLLRTTLASYLGCAPQALRLDQRCARCGAQHGKPRLVKPTSDLAFNLSHAHGLIALAVCRGHEVGIDVEWRERAGTMPELVPLLLSAAERQALEEVPQARRPDLLLDCWVRKEALLKATGEGLVRDLRQLALPLAQDGPLLCRRDGTWWGVRDMDVGPHHVGAVAVHECVPRLAHIRMRCHPG